MVIGNSPRDVALRRDIERSLWRMLDPRSD
jgi:hypothetical protein